MYKTRVEDQDPVELKDRIRIQNLKHGDYAYRTSVADPDPGIWSDPEQVYLERFSEESDLHQDKKSLSNM